MQLGMFSFVFIFLWILHVFMFLVCFCWKEYVFTWILAQYISISMVSAPSPLPPPPHFKWGELIWKFAKMWWGQNFFFCGGGKFLWGELKLCGRSNILFHFFRNSQHPEKWSASLKNFFTKCEWIRSYYLPISSNLLKSPLEKLHFLCLVWQAFWKKKLC